MFTCLASDFMTINNIVFIEGITNGNARRRLQSI
jgi:hypothetical protein